jgi:hypothetical protein
MDIASRRRFRRIVRQARQMADQLERLRYLRRLQLMIPRNNRWGVLPWPPLWAALGALATLATVLLMWREF